MNITSCHTTYFHFCFLREDRGGKFAVSLDWSNDCVQVWIAQYRPGSKCWVCLWCNHFSSCTSHKGSEPQMASGTPGAGRQWGVVEIQYIGSEAGFNMCDFSPLSVWLWTTDLNILCLTYKIWEGIYISLIIVHWNAWSIYSLIWICMNSWVTINISLTVVQYTVWV